MNTEDRIKLAKAMGWTRIKYPTAKIPWRKNDMWQPPHMRSVRYKNPPDPFTDANDDYAVLEWMRNCSEIKDTAVNWKSQFTYQIGDYARAALKVIADQGASVS